MYSKMLVALDGSKLAEQILPIVRWLVKASAIPIELFTVADPDARTPFWPAEVDEKYLKQIAAEYFTSSQVTCTLETGEPAAAITDRAKDDKNCLIGMATLDVGKYSEQGGSDRRQSTAAHPTGGEFRPGHRLPRTLRAARWIGFG